MQASVLAILKQRTEIRECYAAFLVHVRVSCRRVLSPDVVSMIPWLNDVRID
jgi:hypothetical protein